MNDSQPGDRSGGQRPDATGVSPEQVIACPEELLPLVYDELRRIARRFLASERRRSYSPADGGGS